LVEPSLKEKWGRFAQAKRIHINRAFGCYCHYRIIDGDFDAGAAACQKATWAIACKSNLHQWAVIFEMYASQNDGFFRSGDYVRDGWQQYCWTEPLRPFYNNDEKVRLCPMAIKFREEGARDPFAA